MSLFQKIKNFFTLEDEDIHDYSEDIDRIDEMFKGAIEVLKDCVKGLNKTHNLLDNNVNNNLLTTKKNLNKSDKYIKNIENFFSIKNKDNNIFDGNNMNLI